jgi:acetyl-CoA acyltransferase
VTEAFVCDAIRTPIGRFGGSLSSVRADDLCAIPMRTLMERNAGVDAAQIDDVYMGCANQAGEDNRNVARMSLLLAGLPETVPGATVNRLCGSGLNAVGMGARAVKTGEADLIVAGGVENMTRAPFVMAKAEVAFDRKAEIYDTSLGWRFINKALDAQYGTEAMGETAENLAAEHQIEREAQDAFALRSQQRYVAAAGRGFFKKEIVPVTIKQRREEIEVAVDEHPRATTMEQLAKLRPPFRDGGSVTAGNASGLNDGACTMFIASEDGAKANGLTPRARILGMATAGVPPRIMGFGPVPATQKLMEKLGLTIGDFDVVELNEAFAAQALACTRALGLPDDADHVNPNGGAIALGHPLGMSGARLVMTALNQLEETGGKRALCTMCIGVGQGIALAIERV